MTFSPADPEMPEPEEAGEQARPRWRDAPEDGALPHGLHAVLDGVEYPLRTLSARRNLWALWAPRPTPGFVRDGAGFIRSIDEGEALECYRIIHRGTYRGITVSVSGSSNGRVMAVTGDARAREEGFEGFERDQWMKFIPRDDADLRFTASRTPIPMPWRRNAS